MPQDTTWVQGATARNPAMQDYMRLRDSAYERNLSTLNDEFKLEQLRGMAEMGAKILESYGPEGQQWAQNLRSDPYSTYAMAEKMGGFQALEQRLRYAAASGRAAELGGQPGYNEIAGIYGPETAATVAEKLSAANKNAQPEVFGTGKEQTPWTMGPNGEVVPVPGFEQLGVGGAGGAGGMDKKFIQIDQYGVPRDIRTGQPVFGMGNTITPAQITSLKEDREMDSTRYKTASDIVDQTMALDMFSQASDRALITMANKLLDPSAVMQGESEATAAAIRDRVSRITAQIETRISGGTPLTTIERLKIRNTLISLAGSILDEAPNTLRRWKEEDSVMLAGAPPEQAMFAVPESFAGRAAEARKKIDPILRDNIGEWEGETNMTPVSSPGVSSGSIRLVPGMTEADMVDGQTYLDADGATVRWNATTREFE